MALTLLGVWGIGVTLVTSHYLLLGSLFLLLPPIGIIYLYLAQIRTAYQALTRTDTRSDVHPSELIVAVIVLCAMGPFSFYLIADEALTSRKKPEITKVYRAGSRLEFSRIYVKSQPGQATNTAFIEYTNKGDIPAEAPLLVSGTWLKDAALQEDETKRIFDALEHRTLI